MVTCEALSGGTEAERDIIRRLLAVLEYVVLDPDGAASAGELRRAAGRSAGRSLGDALIVALAQRLGATVVTRNAADYAAFDIPVLAYGSA